MGNTQTLWSRTLWQRSLWILAVIFAISGTTFLYFKMRSVNPETHRRVDRALRDLRGLDRTINQDVLRARYRLIDSYDPVLKSYRQFEKLENSIADVPAYLDKNSADAYQRAVTDYRQITTEKQRTIESFKYRAAEIHVLLNYLPSAGLSVTKVATASGDQELIAHTNRIVSLALLYNLTSDEAYAPQILTNLKQLEAQGLRSESHAVRRQVRTFMRNVRELLKVKPEVDTLLRAIFDVPVAEHEEQVADIYYAGYSTAEVRAEKYRLFLYTVSVLLLLSIGIVLMRLKLAARALAQANESLETRVSERTRELDTRNAEMHTVLDNVAQALLTVDKQGRICRERSSKIATWIPGAREGVQIGEALKALDPSAAEWLELGWEELDSEIMPEELILDQLPKRFSTQTQHLDVEYRPIVGSDGKTERYLLVLSDTTELVAHQKKELEQQEQLVAFQHFVGDRAAFQQFIAESERLIEHLSECWDKPGEAFRAVHTLKGNCGLFGIHSVASACHELESQMVENPQLPASARNHLDTSWETFRNGFLTLTGERNDDRVEFQAKDLDLLRRTIRSGASATDLLKVLDRMLREPVRSRLDRLAAHARDLATRLGKGQIDVVIEDNGLRLDDQRWAPFWAASIHVLRNSIDHGLELPETRLRLQKNPNGQLRLSVKEEGESLIVEFADDGQGIDWDAVQRKAERLGLVAATQEELQALLFHGGVSTKESATEFSGRGAGVSATSEACQRLGGTAEIESQKGRGTLFRFRIPHDDVAPRRSILPPASARFLSGYPLLPHSPMPANEEQNFLRSDRSIKIQS